MNEFELIKQVTQGVPLHSDSLVLGVGDDCAVIKGSDGKDLLVTTDALFEGVHFKLEWINARTLGRKALLVNVSDVAAMGGHPLYYLVSIGIPKGFPEREVKELFDGMAQAASGYKMILVGGDTCRSASGLLLSLTVVGEVDHKHCMYRKGAKAGDSVYVTGTVGNAALGMACLEKGFRSMDVRQFLKCHNEPIPRVATGQWLGASSCVSAMIDISDGLVADLGHIAETSSVGVLINADRLPLSKDFIETAARCHKDPVILALTGGEDYELAFTVSFEKQKLFEKMLETMIPAFGHDVTKIGEVTTGSGVKVIDKNGEEMRLASAGFEHRF